MNLAIIEASYSYQMSYLIDWRNAWEGIATKVLNVNLVNGKNLNTLTKNVSDYDLIVILHTATADSNVWLQKLLNLLPEQRRVPVVLFVGNEFSSPWLSTTDRLNNISSLYPDILVSQLSIETAQWLYSSRAKLIVSAPPGIPDQGTMLPHVNKQIDFAYRGFVYPWYLLDNERNEFVNRILVKSRELNLTVNYSQSSRLSKFDWQNLLRQSKFTASTEAGSRFVFRDDDVWQEFMMYLNQNPMQRKSISNDAKGMTFLRRFPLPLKRATKKILNSFGLIQGSLYQPTSLEEEKFLELVSPEKFDYRDGKCISSRHLDAIASHTWQILAPGEYSGILKPNKHYSELLPDGSDLESIIENSLNAFEQDLTISAFEDLIFDNSYASRVRGILSKLR